MRPLRWDPGAQLWLLSNYKSQVGCFSGVKTHVGETYPKAGLTHSPAATHEQRLKHDTPVFHPGAEIHTPCCYKIPRLPRRRPFTFHRPYSKRRGVFFRGPFDTQISSYTHRSPVRLRLFSVLAHEPNFHSRVLEYKQWNEGPIPHDCAIRCGVGQEQHHGHHAC